MRSSAVSLALVASATCVDVKVIWHHEKTAEKPMLSVFDDSNKLIAQSCSSMLVGSPHNIDFSDVDENGFGNFTVGDTQYTSHSKPEFSGGPVCTKKFNDRVAVVECTGITWTPAPDSQIEEDCHDDEDVKATMRFFTSNNRVKAEDFTKAGRDLTPRNPNPPDGCTYYYTTSLVGNGDPHQNYYDKQLSENINCGPNPGCSVGENNSKSFSIGWTFGLSGTKPFEWISGGFSVSETWTTGSSYTCPGAPNEEACVWYNTAHTAYTAQNEVSDTCDPGWSPTGDPSFIIFSPNAQNRGGGYYCVVGTCRAQGDAYWDYSGPAGGP